MIDKIGQMVRSNRRSKPAALVAKAAEKYLRAFHNEAFYDFGRNGERFAMEAFGRWAGSRSVTVWDVGANHGQWAREAHTVLPNAKIISFEVIPSVAAKIRDEAKDQPWWEVAEGGLSDHAGSVDVTWNHRNDDTSAVAPRADNPWFDHPETEVIACPVSTIDAYAAEHGAPDFLKIDTEGHEAAILAGGASLLGGSSAPPIIQFEYGDTWIGADQMLGPVQRRLEGFGYSVGRLFPNHVTFRPYASADENFRMGNIVAVRDNVLREMLA